MLLALSLVAASRGTLQSGARASHCGGFSCRGARAPRCTGPAAAVPGLLAPRHVGYSRPGTRPVSPASAAGLFTPSDQGSPCGYILDGTVYNTKVFFGGVGPVYLFFPFIACSFGVISKNPLCVCSVAKSYLTLCDPVDFSMPGLSCLHYLLEFAQIKNASAYNWKSQRFASSFFFFFGCCIPLALIFRSVMHFELIFACDGR